MTLAKKRLLFYIIFYGVMSVIAVLDLVLYVNTIPLNDRNRQLKQDIQKVRQENNMLKLTIMQRHRFDNIERIARTELDMVPQREIRYIYVPKANVPTANR